MSKKEIFISYGREPEVKQFVRKLRDDLQNNRFTVWLDETDIPAGADFREAIGTGLCNCSALIAIITQKYIHSRYCKSELYYATSEDKRIYPVIYEEVDFAASDTGRGVKLEISGINWTMFRPRVDDYEESLDKLMQGLAAIKGSSQDDSQLSEHKKIKWKGYYQQGGVKYDMILPSLEFDSTGKISGEGVDEIGNFNISGLQQASGEVQFIKQYVGKHAVYYNGFCTNNVIHGNWSIPNCGYSDSFELTGSSQDDSQLSKHKKNKWKGYYQQGGVKYDMILPSLEFDSTGKISGEGVDEIGNFNISGLQQASGEVQFIKQYVGKHAVYYNGFHTNNVIHGNWSIPNCGYSGSFELTEIGGQQESVGVKKDIL